MTIQVVASNSSTDEQTSLATDAHVKFVQSLDTDENDYDYWLTEHLRLNGLYWGLTALHLLGHPDALSRADTIDFVLSCQHDSGGFGAAPGHDAHLLYTVSAVQILVTVDALDQLELRGRAGRERVGQFIAQLQNRTTGSFAGDEWGEEDTRFLYGAFNALSLLSLLHLINMEKAVQHVVLCANFDGGYGATQGSESHAAHIFTCVGALAIANRLDLVDADRTGRWLCERQVSTGGLNGRPEKEEDVCYSWWVLSSLTIIQRAHWIDSKALARYILACQGPTGGLADRPGNAVDVWHTLFGLAGLSLLGFPDVKAIDAIYCMPKQIVQTLFGRHTG